MQASLTPLLSCLEGHSAETYSGVLLTLPPPPLRSPQQRSQKNPRRGLPLPRRRSSGMPAGFGSVAWSMPLGLIFGRPDPPLSRAISSRCAATVRRNSAISSQSFNTKLFRSACERPSRSAGGDIPRMNLTRAVLGIVQSYRRDFCPSYPRLALHLACREWHAGAVGEAEAAAPSAPGQPP